MSVEREERIRLGALHNIDELQRDPRNIGPWLALNDLGDRYEVVARGESASEVLDAARSRGVSMPVVTKIPDPSIPLFL